METLEKFKYYKSLLLRYRKMRFGFLRFSGLSLLILMLGVSARPDLILLSENFVFVFVSLFVFRWIDDAWSFYSDRLDHPERFYILPEHLKSFAILGSVIFILYQTGLFFSSIYTAKTILVLFIVSTVFYTGFYRNKHIMTIIPLLKYPVFVWCISGFSMSGEVLFLASGSFFMMLAVDFLQETPPVMKGISVKLVLLFVTGLLVMQPWSEKGNILTDVAMIILPLLFLFLKPLKAWAVFPAIYYPVMHIIDILL
jgi:hypothetical protein